MRCLTTVYSLVLAIAMLITSCTSLGPRTIPRDQFDYGTAISNAWKEQLLFNVVGLRYVEAPVFVNLSSVINQYSLEGEVSLGGGSNTSFTGDDTLTVGGAARYADRPTITYIPITGQKFARSLLTPIPPESLFALIQSGWSPEFVLRLTVKSINGVNNAQAGPGNRRDADPNFLKVLSVWRRLRAAGVIGLRREGDGGNSRILVYHRRARVTDETETDLAFLQQALGLDPTESEYELRYGLVAERPTEIVVLTSSILEIMNELAWRIEVPGAHIEDGRTLPGYDDANSFPDPLIRVHSSAEKPEDSFVKIRKRDNWYYIEDTDIASKRSFAMLQLMLNLTDTGDTASGPVVTISN